MSKFTKPVRWRRCWSPSSDISHLEMVKFFRPVSSERVARHRVTMDNSIHPNKLRVVGDDNFSNATNLFVTSCLFPRLFHTNEYEAKAMWLGTDVEAIRRSEVIFTFCHNVWATRLLHSLLHRETFFISFTLSKVRIGLMSSGSSFESILSENFWRQWCVGCCLKSFL